MEQYLIDEYGVLEDERWLTSVDDIEDFIRGTDNLFECGQGYYNDEEQVILKIQDKFYKVEVRADIGSAKQEYGERLYWIEGIRSITYEEIDKPLPKERKNYNYEMSMTSEQHKKLEQYLKNNLIDYNME